ncbi:MAG: hypothetical protein Q8N12_00305 [Thermodesulfovibrionales bacterium]|nr:hypothetical protein [Thermodesulfovibrionales bacterium]
MVINIFEDLEVLYYNITVYNFIFQAVNLKVYIVDFSFKLFGLFFQVFEFFQDIIHIGALFSFLPKHIKKVISFFIDFGKPVLHALLFQGKVLYPFFLLFCCTFNNAFDYLGVFRKKLEFINDKALELTGADTAYSTCFLAVVIISGAPVIKILLAFGKGETRCHGRLACTAVNKSFQKKVTTAIPISCLCYVVSVKN